MGVTTVSYCTREDVKRATDMFETARNNWQVDRAIQSSARNIEAHLNRVFYPTIATRYFDWPNYQYAYPWRLWLEQNELAGPPTAVTSGGKAIPLSAVNPEPINTGPPYTYIELRRDLSYAFGTGQTPQRDIAITGPFGFGADTAPAGQLVGAITVSSISLIVSDGSLVGVGDLLIVGSERMLVRDRSSLDTGQTNLAGATTANSADVAITVTDGTQLHIDETLQLDSERMLIVDITGNIATVKRAWDGTVLATHSTGTHLYAFRTLSVLRAQCGTSAATHSNSDAVSVHQAPTLIRDLSIAEASNRVLQETGAYRDPQGEGDAAVHGLGSALADLWDEARTAYGRKGRQRVI